MSGGTAAPAACPLAPSKAAGRHGLQPRLLGSRPEGRLTSCGAGGEAGLLPAAVGLLPAHCFSLMIRELDGQGGWLGAQQRCMAAPQLHTTQAFSLCSTPQTHHKLHRHKPGLRPRGPGPPSCGAGWPGRRQCPQPSAAPRCRPSSRPWSWAGRPASCCRCDRAAASPERRCRRATLLRPAGAAECCRVWEHC